MKKQNWALPPSPSPAHRSFSFISEKYMSGIRTRAARVITWVALIRLLKHPKFVIYHWTIVVTETFVFGSQIWRENTSWKKNSGAIVLQQQINDTTTELMTKYSKPLYYKLLFAYLAVKSGMRSIWLSMSTQSRSWRTASHFSLPLNISNIFQNKNVKGTTECQKFLLVYLVRFSDFLILFLP
jgi:hypothetical protein